MKILKIEHCYGCKYYRCTFDHNIGVSRILCQHPAWKDRRNGGRIINKKLAMKGEIPRWCNLEDYKSENIN